MLRVARCTVVAASITLVLAGCQDAAAPSHGSPALGATPTMSIQANPPFVLHQVPPASTDNNIDKWLSDHFVWLYPGAERGEKLFVHLPGGANPIQVPASFQFLAREAARLGYHVIVLTYPNQDRGIELLCGGNPACEENVRLDIIDGGDRSFPVVDVSRANSIDNRLTKLLERLTLDHPEEGWSQFLNDGEPNWSQIVLSGFSFGGSEAAMLAKLHRVNRVTLFAAPRDADATAGGQPPPWVALGETPSERYYGLVHQQDPLSALTLTSWREKLDMQQFGEAVFEDASMSAPPYGNTHMLVTNRRTRVGTDLNPYLNAHGSAATDQFTPLDAPTLDYPDGKPQLRDAWRYILGPDQEPPALTVPADFTVNATSPSGALVSYVVSASDNVAVASLTCSPMSGSGFAIGSTGVTCIATDPSGNQASATFRVTVLDQEPPALTMPADFAVNATSPSGAVVSYVVSASDNVAVASLTCSPTSGSGFAIGTTGVTCMATDPSGNQARATFRVTVLDAPAQLANLDETVGGLGLPRGIATSLKAKLNAALAAANVGDVVTACTKLQDFINETRAQAGKMIPMTDAALLVTEAERIRAVLGC